MTPELKAMLPDERRRNALDAGGGRTPRIDFTPEELAEFAALIAERARDEVRAIWPERQTPVAQKEHGYALAVKDATRRLGLLATRWRSFPPTRDTENV